MPEARPGWSLIRSPQEILSRSDHCTTSCRLCASSISALWRGLGRVVQETGPVGHWGSGLAHLPQFSSLHSGHILYTGCTVLADSLPWVPDSKPDALSRGASPCVGRICCPRKKEGKEGGTHSALGRAVSEIRDSELNPWPTILGFLGWSAQSVEAAESVEAAQCFATSKGKVDLGRPPEILSFPRWLLVSGWHCGGQ